jgi:hypothetical protein
VPAVGEKFLENHRGLTKFLLPEHLFLENWNFVHEGFKLLLLGDIKDDSRDLRSTLLGQQIDEGGHFESCLNNFFSLKNLYLTNVILIEICGQIILEKFQLFRKFVSLKISLFFDLLLSHLSIFFALLKA